MFNFTGAISRPVLDNYLSRAITMVNLFASPTLDDDLRMLKNIGAKFIGRAVVVWGAVADDDRHFAQVAQVATQVHAIDAEIILQAAIFESIHQLVNTISIPAWVFTEFGLPVAERTFSYEAMLFPDGRHVDQWGANCSVPDICQLETQMWFYYRAKRYIDAGYEALHLGQVHLYASLDRGYLATKKLLTRIRAYARTHARRGLVLCDAHTNGIVINGRLLFDVHATIFFLREIDGQPCRTAIVSHGASLGGITPSGWSCAHLPYLIEFDNYGGAITRASASINVRKADGSSYHPGEQVPGVLWPWGYDEIGWFANQPEEYRNAFLDYARQWLAVNEPAGHLEMPGRRMLGGAAIGEVTSYCANTRSAACPTGFSQEETIKALWATESLTADVEKITDEPGSMDPCCVDPVTGFHYPNMVVLTGDLQAALGVRAWDPTSEVTRLQCQGDGRYALRLVFPIAGAFRFRVTINGSWTENYGQRTIADGENFTVTVPTIGAVMDFLFDYQHKTLAISTVECDREIVRQRTGNSADVRR